MSTESIKQSPGSYLLIADTARLLHERPQTSVKLPSVDATTGGVIIDTGTLATYLAPRQAILDVQYLHTSAGQLKSIWNATVQIYGAGDRNGMSFAGKTPSLYVYEDTDDGRVKFWIPSVENDGTGTFPSITATFKSAISGKEFLYHALNVTAVNEAPAFDLVKIKIAMPEVFLPGEIRQFVGSPGQVIKNETGTWLALNGVDVTPFMADGYAVLLNSYPGLFASDTEVFKPMTAADAPAPQVVTTSANSATNYAGWRAFATANTYAWRSGNFSAASTGSTGNQWIQIDLGAGNAKVVAELTLQIDALNNAPEAFTLSGSNDGTNFTELLSVSAQGLASLWVVAQESKSWAVTNQTQAFRYLRITVTRIRGTTATYVSFRNVWMSRGGAQVIDTTNPTSGAVDYVKVP
jgi:hypothetical protein